jgi:hypothetical protein
MDVLDLHPAVAVPGPDSAVFVVPPDHVRLNFGEALLATLRAFHAHVAAVVVFASKSGMGPINLVLTST